LVGAVRPAALDPALVSPHGDLFGWNLHGLGRLGLGRGNDSGHVLSLLERDANVQETTFRRGTIAPHLFARRKHSVPNLEKKSPPPSETRLFPGRNRQRGSGTIRPPAPQRGEGGQTRHPQRVYLIHGPVAAVRPLSPPLRRRG